VYNDIPAKNMVCSDISNNAAGSYVVCLSTRNVNIALHEQTYSRRRRPSRCPRNLRVLEGNARQPHWVLAEAFLVEHPRRPTRLTQHILSTHTRAIASIESVQQNETLTMIETVLIVRHAVCTRVSSSLQYSYTHTEFTDQPLPKELGPTTVTLFCNSLPVLIPPRLTRGSEI
jgi:hypothetical protein